MNPEIIETLKLLVEAIALVICIAAIVCIFILGNRNIALRKQLDEEKKQIRLMRKEIESYKFVTKANEDVNRELQLRAEKLDLELRQTKARLDHKKIPTV